MSKVRILAVTDIVGIPRTYLASDILQSNLSTRANGTEGFSHNSVGTCTEEAQISHLDQCLDC